jgi:glycosidase
MQMMKLIYLLVVIGLVSCKAPEDKDIQTHPTNWNNEIIYHVMPRSFYDSNGDLHGDLNGFIQKLPYLKELGVTTILFTPLYESGFYHNYFPTNYANIDEEYGTMEEYLLFVNTVHENGLKFLMDMETQYAHRGNLWFDDSYQNPASEYSAIIYYSDSLNQFPEQIFMPAKSPLFDFKAWPDNHFNIVLLDLNHDRVRTWMKDFFVHWVDPNQDGDLSDGVDGFRIDHIMDDLDNKGVFTNLYKDLWAPIFQACRDVNPNLFIVGEQADWSEYGDGMVKSSGANAAFSFPLRFALAGEYGKQDMYTDATGTKSATDPDKIHSVVQKSTELFNKDSAFTVNFLENHDIDRWATSVNNHAGQMRTGAILNLLLPGVPSIYYGQELGLTGRKHEWGSDENHIPVREAFPWTSNIEDSGNAIFYKDTGPCWDSSFWKTDAIKKLALPVQQSDAASLWNHYKRLIEIRKSHVAFRTGTYSPMLLENKNLLAFERSTEYERVVVIINLSAVAQPIDKTQIKEILYGSGNDDASLPPFGFIISKN